MKVGLGGGEGVRQRGKGWREQAREGDGKKLLLKEGKGRWSGRKAGGARTGCRNPQSVPSV